MYFRRSRRTGAHEVPLTSQRHRVPASTASCPLSQIFYASTVGIFVHPCQLADLRFVVLFPLPFTCFFLLLARFFFLPRVSACVLDHMICKENAAIRHAVGLRYTIHTLNLEPSLKDCQRNLGLTLDSLLVLIFVPVK